VRVGKDATRIDLANATRMASTTNLEFGAATEYFTDDGSQNVTFTGGSDFTVDVTGDIVLDADGDNISFKAGGADTTGLSFNQSNTGDWTIKPGQANKDIIFTDSGDAEIWRLDASQDSLLMAGTNKIEFTNGNNHIQVDTDLKITAAADIILTPGGGDVLPDGDNTRNLGSASKRWANVYTGDLHLKNDRGDWTMVEEDEYLSITNNKTGKKFRLLMEEVDDDPTPSEDSEINLNDSPPKSKKKRSL